MVELGEGVGDDVEADGGAEATAKILVDLLGSAGAVDEGGEEGEGLGHDDLVVGEVEGVTEKPHLFALVVDGLEIEGAEVWF